MIVAKGGGASQELPYGTSFLVYADPHNLPEERVTILGLQVMSLPYALCKVTATYFQKNGKEAELALRLLRDPSELTAILIKYNFKSAANRLVGALEFLGSKRAALQIKEDLSGMGWNIKEENPFHSEAPLLSAQKLASPYVARILSLWSEYRSKIIPYFPETFVQPGDFNTYLNHVEELYEQDAYNSLSIEGYQVNEDLIARIQQNGWNPEVYDHDRTERNALAARGYYEAFIQVKKSIQKLFQEEDLREVAQSDLPKWFQSLFARMVRVGILRKEELFEKIKCIFAARAMYLFQKRL